MIRQYIKSLIVGGLVLLMLGCSGASKKSQFELQKHKSIRLKNGMRVLLLEDKKLPSFSLVMMVESGSTSDPMGKSGLAQITASLLDKGSEQYSATEVADNFGQLGTSFSASVAKDFTFLSTSGLSFHREKLLSYFAESIRAPKLSEKEMVRQRKKAISQIRNVVDRPNSFASLLFYSYLYGAHPYSRASLGTARDLESVSRQDVLNYYEQHYQPNNIWLAVVGDYGEGIEAALEKNFGDWKTKSKPKLKFPNLPEIQGVQIQLITKKDLKQSEVRLGHKGIQRSNPDFLKLRIANTILGGAFSSRLMEEIRMKRGLTYSIYSRFDALMDHGPFRITSSTRHEKVGELVTESLKELKRLHKDGVTEEELKMAKAYLKGIFPRALETSEKTANNMLILRFYGISDNYLTDYLKNIESISQKDVNQAVRKYMDPENIKILVYSPEKQVIDQLRPIGTVRIRSYREFM